jgi:hypothetical protein
MTAIFMADDMSLPIRIIVKGNTIPRIKKGEQELKRLTPEDTPPGPAA